MQSIWKIVILNSIKSLSDISILNKLSYGTKNYHRLIN